jgi:hypothetical protein
MLFFVEHVMVEYMLIEMALDAPTNDKAKKNFDLLCDVQGLLPFYCCCN